VGKDNITSSSTNITTSGREVVILVNKDVILSLPTLYKGGEERL
jgi:hypothetical protein